MPKRVEAELFLDVHAHVGECPLWWPERDSLVWVDPPRRVVHVTDTVAGSDREVTLDGEVSAVAPAQSGAFVVAVEDGIGLLDLDTGAFERISTLVPDPAGRFNDGACDPAGRFLAGTFAWDMSPQAGALFRFDPDGSVARVLDGVTVSNGLRWSPDGEVMYYIDSMTGTVDAFRYDIDTGALHDRRALVTLPDADAEGGADGMTVDAEGGLWVAVWGHGEIRRFTPDGRHDCTVGVPTRYVTSCEFGGPALDILYITSSAVPMGDPTAIEPRPAGALFACRPGVTGLPARRFGR
jgi:sugar lactone lactonase YvrE